VERDAEHRGDGVEAVQTGASVAGRLILLDLLLSHAQALGELLLSQAGCHSGGNERARKVE